MLSGYNNNQFEFSKKSWSREGVCMKSLQYIPTSWSIGKDYKSYLTLMRGIIRIESRDSEHWGMPIWEMAPSALIRRVTSRLTNVGRLRRIGKTMTERGSSNHKIKSPAGRKQIMREFLKIFYTRPFSRNKQCLTLKGWHKTKLQLQRMTFYRGILFSWCNLKCVISKPRLNRAVLVPCIPICRGKIWLEFSWYCVC